MKNLILSLVVSFGLAACDGAGLPGGVDATDADAGGEVVGLDGGACTQQLAASVHGDNWRTSWAFQPSASEDVKTMTVYLDGNPIPRACWFVDSSGSWHVNQAVFPNADVHKISLSFGCVVAVPADSDHLCS